MKKLLFSVPLIIMFTFITTSNAGFVSSNGMSRPAGIICTEQISPTERVEWQVKMILQSSTYIARKVVFKSDGQTEVTQLSSHMTCENSRHSKEPTIENRCSSESLDQSETLSVFQSIPFGDSLLFIVQSPLVIGGVLKKIFSAAQCQVVIVEKIKP